jgi:peptide/nickel transport system ATP-binding protein
MSALLSVRNLTVSLPTDGGMVRALRDVSFSLMRGQTLGLIGESGCGKSLTALAVMGLLPDRAQVAGSIRLDEKELVGLDDTAMCKLRGARMAMIFQEPMTALNPVHTIARQICEPLQLHLGLSAAQARPKALELLERVQLAQARQRLDAYPHQLSGGQRQRVMIAMALACGPDVLIADEPTTALDVTVQKQVLALIADLVKQDGMAMLLISHDLGLMRDQVEQVAVMYGGSVVEQADTAGLFAQRCHPYTNGLFAARPRLGMARGTRLATIPGRVPPLSQLPPGCTFAPRCNRVVAECSAALPALEPLSATHTVRCPRWNAI